MVGKFGRLREGAPWVCFLVSQFYTSIAFVLAQNKEALTSSSPEFQQLVEQVHRKNFKASFQSNRKHEKIVRFALKKAAKMVHHSPIECNIVPSVRQELDFSEEFLKPDHGVSWESPLAFLIKRMPFSKACGDSCLDACGGFSIKLDFCWLIEFPKNVVQCTLKHLADNRDNNLISVNVLEFFRVVINYCAALTALKTGNYTSDPHPDLLNMTDNTSAHSWSNHTCKNSRLRKLLAKFFCYLLMD